MDALRKETQQREKKVNLEVRQTSEKLETVSKEAEVCAACTQTHRLPHQSPVT